MIELKGDYQLQDVLWTGENVITYLAVHKNMGAKVIVKEFFPAKYVFRSEESDVQPKPGSEDNYAAGLSRFRQEADILWDMGKYGYIPQILELLELHNTYYIVLDYKPGVTLAEYMSDRENSRQNIKKVFHSLFETLMFLHKKGVVHLDIRPENLIIENQELYLIDFGSAEYILKLSDKKCGEVASGYEAPELKGTGMPIGTWTDVYEMCMVMYHYLGCELPENWMAMTGYKERKCYLMHSLKGYEDCLRRGLVGGLAYRPERRFHTVAKLYNGFYRSINFHPLMLVCGSLALIGALAVMSELRVQLPAGSEVSYESFAKDIPGYTDESLLDYVIGSNSISIVGCDIALTEVYIPPEIYGVKVTKIAGMGPNVVTVFIPDGVYLIESGAFRNCKFLERIFISKSVTTIGKDSFLYCSMLHNIFLEKGQGRYYLVDGILTDNMGEEFWNNHEK